VDRSRPVHLAATWMIDHGACMAMNKRIVSSAPFAGVFVLRALACAQPANADDLASYEITLKDHHFTPAEIHVPTGKPFIVVITNANDGPDEFEMLLPALERPLQPGQQGKVRVRPLPPGRFPFFGESDPDNETGAFISE
jgi:Cupredoxin-like domain